VECPADPADAIRPSRESTVTALHQQADALKVCSHLCDARSRNRRRSRLLPSASGRHNSLGVGGRFGCSGARWSSRHALAFWPPLPRTRARGSERPPVVRDPRPLRRGKYKEGAPATRSAFLLSSSTVCPALKRLQVHVSDAPPARAPAGREARSRRRPSVPQTSR
jgi:hypothetical protein